MLLAILIFLLLILILSLNIHINLLSRNDTIKLYVKIAKLSFNVPYQKLLNNEGSGNSIIKIKHKKLILNILSRSTIDHIYIAKYTNKDIRVSPLVNAMFLLFSNLLVSILHCRSRHVNTKDLRLEYAASYENIDYYFAAHLDIISLIWAAIKSIGGK